MISNIPREEHLFNIKKSKEILMGDTKASLELYTANKVWVDDLIYKYTTEYPELGMQLISTAMIGFAKGVISHEAVAGYSYKTHLHFLIIAEIELCLWCNSGEFSDEYRLFESKVDSKNEVSLEDYLRNEIGDESINLFLNLTDAVNIDLEVRILAASMGINKYEVNAIFEKVKSNIMFVVKRDNLDVIIDLLPKKSQYTFNDVENLITTYKARRYNTSEDFTDIPKIPEVKHDNYCDECKDEFTLRKSYIMAFSNDLEMSIDICELPFRIVDAVERYSKEDLKLYFSDRSATMSDRDKLIVKYEFDALDTEEKDNAVKEDPTHIFVCLDVDGDEEIPYTKKSGVLSGVILKNKDTFGKMGAKKSYRKNRHKK